MLSKSKRESIMIIMMNMGNKYIRLSYWKQFKSRNHSEKMEKVRKRRDIIYIPKTVK